MLGPCGLPYIEGYKYGFDAHPGIRVRLPNPGEYSGGDGNPMTYSIMLNREFNCGYWDFELNQFSNDAKLLFVDFYDWGGMHVRDHYYVRAKVIEWPEHPETLGKHALIESHIVRYDFADKPGGKYHL